MKAYTVNYKMHSAAETKWTVAYADNKAEAYDKATFEEIPKKEGAAPYAAWVAAVTYNNGNYKRFNNFEGKPY